MSISMHNKGIGVVLAHRYDNLGVCLSIIVICNIMHFDNLDWQFGKGLFDSENVFSTFFSGLNKWLDIPVVLGFG